MQNNIWKQQLHLEPKKGWLNDPNGLVYYQGNYQIFHQYSYEVNGGKKYWYQYTSKDLISYIDKGVFLSPDTEYDKSGVYSGSANIENGELSFYYTGNVKYKGDYDYVHNGRGHNTIKMTTKDMINFSEKKCLLTTSDYPDMSNHVRDPKIYEKNSDSYMILGARDSKDTGCLLIYKNDEYYKTVYANKNLGYMWECPDYFEIAEKEIFIFSPQGIANMYPHYKNTYQVGYSLVEEGIENIKEIQNFTLLDYGHDFYAPQTFLDENGKRTMLVWMYVPDSPYQNATVKYGYQNCLSTPRILDFKNNKLVQQFHSSIYNLLSNEITDNKFNETTWYYKQEDEHNFSIKVDTLEIKYTSGELFVDIEKCGCGRDNRVIKKHIKNIEIVFDNSSFEILANDGEFSFSSRYYPSNHEVVIESKQYTARKIEPIIIKGE